MARTRVAPINESGWARDYLNGTKKLGVRIGRMFSEYAPEKQNLAKNAIIAGVSGLAGILIASCGDDPFPGVNIETALGGTALFSAALHGYRALKDYFSYRV